MKFSFEIARSNGAALPDTGARIKRPAALPTDAAALDLLQWKRNGGGKGPFKNPSGRSARAYDLALTTLQSADFSMVQSSANAEVGVSWLRATPRARALVRDNPYAENILRIKRNNVVGHRGFRLEMAVAKDGKKSSRPATDRDAADKVELAWAAAGKPENCTVKKDISRLELYLMMKSSAYASGAVLARHHRAFAFNKFGYAIQPLEVDRLDPMYQGYADQIGSGPTKADPKNPIRMSIERHPDYGFAVAYWVLTRHPGETTFLGVTEGLDRKVFRQRIAAADIIYFNNFRDRPEQERGFTGLASVGQRLHRIDQWDVSYETACIWRACNSVQISRDNPTGVEYQGDEEDDMGEQIDVAEPGTIRVLPPGFKLQAVDTKFPEEAGVGFKVDMLRGAAAGGGVPYHTLSNDLERVNFSSGRLGENAARDEFMVEQELMIENFVFPHFAEWLRYALLSRAIDLPVTRYDELLAAASFNGRRWPYVNPLQDIQATGLAIELGLTSRDYEIKNGERGDDLEVVDGEIAHGREVDAENGLDFTGLDPAKPTVPKGTPGQTVPNTASPSQEEAPPDPPAKDAKARHKILTPERLAFYAKLEALWPDAEIKPRTNGELNGRH